MPDTYTVTGPSGDALTFVGDRPPTAEELQQLGVTPGASSSASDTPNPAYPWRRGSIDAGEDRITTEPAANTSALLQALGPLAHPETLSDFANLLSLPVDNVRKAFAIIAARGPIGDAVTRAGSAVERAGNTLENPARYVGVYELLSHPKRALAMLAAPQVLQGAGRFLQKAGGAMAGEGTPAGAAVAGEGTPAVAAVAGEAPMTPRPADAAAPAPPAPAAAPVASTAAPMSPAMAANTQALTEVRAAVAQLVSKGVKPDLALKTVLALRKSPAFAGLPSDAEVAAAVGARNATGHWPAGTP